MKVLLAEYATANDPALAPEGAAMLRVLAASFGRCGYEVVSPGPGDFGEEIARLAPGCDCGLVIAPDCLLYRYTAILERLTHNLGCGSMNAAVSADKRQTSRILARHGIAVPEEVPKGKGVVKPVTGCGSLGVVLTDRAPGPGEIATRYIEGEHLSVSLVASRVVGNACLYYTGEPSLPLALNRQIIRIDDEGRFHYEGGETPVDHPRREEIRKTAARAVQVLGCQGYAGVDLVVTPDQVYVVDVNPRITTSIVGIVACMDEEIADILVMASRGEALAPVHLHGHVRFDSKGTVIHA
ncbi:MAG: ATP-grasp domain-containing protein [Methanoregulaceae archaeon]|nr:ATP-grasp domain-containing protein [Methanoregulaceae archaeon]